MELFDKLNQLKGMKPQQSPIGMPPVAMSEKDEKNKRLAIMLYALGGALRGKSALETGLGLQKTLTGKEKEKKQMESTVGYLKSQGATDAQINLFKDNPALASAYITSTFQQPKSSAERFSIFDKTTGLPAGSVLKSDLQKIAEIENDPRYLIAPLAGIPKDAAGSIEIKELVDESGLFVENITEKDWLKRKEAGTLQSGYKLRNLGSGIKAADSGPERMDKAFAPTQEQFIAGEVLITGLSDTAKILAENPAIANDVVTGGAKVYSFIQSNVKGFDDLITRGQNSAVYNDVSKSKTSYDSKRNWSKEIDSLVSATGITESRIIDMAFALSAAKGQEGKGLSDRDFQNAIDMLSKGYNVDQKIDLFNDIAGRITTEFNIGRRVMISQNPAMQDRYNALGDLSSFIDPRSQQTPPSATGGPRRIRRQVL
tara:strand:- start:5237 stop:6520 length:1284 start_codon:yes stop_codon:yes gene_type:complete